MFFLHKPYNSLYFIHSCKFENNSLSSYINVDISFIFNQYVIICL